MARKPCAFEVQQPHMQTLTLTLNSFHQASGFPSLSHPPPPIHGHSDPRPSVAAERKGSAQSVKLGARHIVGAQ